MKNLKQNLLSFAKLIVIMGVISVATNVSAQQWATQLPGNNSPFPPQENIEEPLNVSSSAQIKDGPLIINNDNIATNFGLTVPYKGILLGDITPANIIASSGSSIFGQLHIWNGLGYNPTCPVLNSSPVVYYHCYPGTTGSGTTLPPPSIRVDGTGPALVTSSGDAKIGIGTLNPQYSIDIPDINDYTSNIYTTTGISINSTGNTGAHSLSIIGGRIKIMGGNPFPGAVLTLINNEGEAIWSTFPSYQPTGGTIQYMDEYWQDGVMDTFAAYGNNNPFRNLRPGVWRITVYGTTGEIGNDNPHTIRVWMTCPITNPLSRNIEEFHINNNPDGNAEFSVTTIVNLPLPGSGGSCGSQTPLEIGVSEYINGVRRITPPYPLINGITAVRLGS